MKTIGIDTNILLDFILQRKPRYKKVHKLFSDCLSGKIKIYIPLPTFLETEWVLRSFYKRSKDEIVSLFDELVILPNLYTDKMEEFKFAVNLYRESKQISFTDCMIVTQIKNSNSDQFLTFDENLEKVYKQSLPLYGE